ncbi:GH3 family domain-containing protein [Halovulum sp. GXIMD14794]
MSGPRYMDFTPLMRRYARLRVRQLEAIRPAEAQEAALRTMLRKARETEFGRTHRFDQISDVASFQRAVPVRKYEDFWDGWWAAPYPTLENVSWPGEIPFFAMTSGTTTGRSKYIPYTEEMRWSAARGFLDLLCFHLINRPQSHMLGGTALGLTGPTSLDPSDEGATAAAVSAITAAALPSLLRKRFLPPPELADLEDWQEKIRRLAPLALGSDLRVMGGSPNWLLLFLAEVAKSDANHGSRLVDWFPHLELIVHGGVNFAPYRDRFAALLEGGHAETREMYSASEGVFAYADRGDGEGLRLHLDGRIFFEFVPPEQLDDPGPDRRWIANVTPGQDYALVISTAAGLWSYCVGDIVRVVDFDPPRLVVTGRVRQSLSAFGEHLIESEIADAVAEASRTLDMAILDYSVAASRETAPGHHEYLIEATTSAPRDCASHLANAIDRRLAELNADYAELRQSRALGPPRIRLVAPGGFSTWMKRRRKLGGQNKVPRIVTDPALFADIAQVVCDPEAADE